MTIPRYRLPSVSRPAWPKQRDRGGALLLALIGLALGTTLGAVAMWLFDPAHRGTRREMADRVGAIARDIGRAGSKRIAHIEAVAHGKAAGLAHLRDGHTPPSDAALADKVRSELGADPDVPRGELLINVEHGTVVLRGEVDADVVRSIERKVKRIPGVREVRSLLATKPTPIEVS